MNWHVYAQTAPDPWPTVSWPGSENSEYTQWKRGQSKEEGVAEAVRERRGQGVVRVPAGTLCPLPGRRNQVRPRLPPPPGSRLLRKMKVAPQKRRKEKTHH